MHRFSKALLAPIISILLFSGLVLFLQTQAARAETAPPQAQVINAGLAYLQSQQQPNGGIIGFSGAPDPDTTARTVLAYIVAGRTVSELISTEGMSMLDYLAAQAITFTHDTTGTLFPGRAGELLAAVTLAGGNPHNFGGMDLVSELQASYLADSGAYSTGARQDFTSGEASDLNQAWAILGLSLSGEIIPDPATQYLVQSQAEDGSWGAGDPDTTALAMTALLASRNVNAQNPAVQKAIDFFHASQADSGGWKPSWDTDPLNADSTGWIIQALVSAGEDLRGQSWVKNSTNPVDALLSLQKPDGSIGGTYANTYSTAEAIIGLAGVPLTTHGKQPVMQYAGLAIFSADSTLYTGCISFTGSISGLDLLQRSGLAIETATNPNQGTAVCKIGDVGDPSSKCFGSMPDYWAYWILGETGWEYSAQGAGQNKVADGGVYAWTWGPGNAPAILTFQDICMGVAGPLPTALSTATSTSSTATTTSSPATPTTPPTPRATLVPTQVPTQPTSSTTTGGTSTLTYVIYAVILLVLGLLIILLIRGRRA